MHKITYFFNPFFSALRRYKQSVGAVVVNRVASE